MSSTLPLTIEVLDWTQSITRVLDAAEPGYLIVCSSREEFLQTLVKEASTRESNASIGEETMSILHSTISQISASTQIQVVFTSSLMHFRAFLTAMPIANETFRTLSILGLPDLHISTNELSSQNLSRSVAVAVEAAEIKGLKLEFLCPRQVVDDWDGDERRRRTCIWEKRLPILSSPGRNEEERAWTGRTVMMGHVFAQWCKVVKADENS